MSIPEDAPRPRLCHLRKRPDFQGYGFNLHAEKGKSGQFIGKVDEGSPADVAGLREGDRIIEVNGVNVANENHAQVVERIKSVPDETKFLVVDSEADDYYRDRKIVIHGGMDNVLVTAIVADKIEDMIEDKVEEIRENGDAKSLKSSSSSSDDDEEERAKHRPRLCVMRIWDDFPGYGFNLHAEKGKPAQFIGKVDEKSPAEAAGLREGDRIIEVNGSCVLTDTHGEVVKKIKTDPKKVSLLLVDPDAEKYFEKKGVTISSSLDFVDRIECPEKNPHEIAVAAAVVEAIHDSDFGDHKVRLCHVKAGSKGFGFNMQTEKGQPGQFIGSVDDDSPAERAGLKKGDRIIEVNGESVEGNTHKQGLKKGDRTIEVNWEIVEGNTHKLVVDKIKAKPGETTLLVVDKDADKFFTEKNIKLAATLACVVKLESGHENGIGDRKSAGEGNDYENVADEIAAVAKKEEKADEKKKEETKKTELKVIVEPTSSSPTNNNNTKSSSKTVESPKSPPVVINGIEFAGSVEEAKRKASKKKRNSVKENNMSMKDKFEMFQKL